MAIPAKPTITAPPNDLPTRGENETNFSNKINNLVAWYPDLTDNLNDSIDWIDLAFTATETEALAAAASASDASTSETNAAASETAALGYRNESETFKDSAETAAAAAQAAAGLPSLTGNSGASLLVNVAENGVEWGFPNNAIKTVFTSSGTWTKDANTNFIVVHIIGGGGSGAIRAGDGGGGAGGGGALLFFKATDLSATESVVVGSGGAGVVSAGPGADGNDGGSSSFSGITVRGGNGGVGSVAALTTSSKSGFITSANLGAGDRDAFAGILDGWGGGFSGQNLAGGDSHYGGGGGGSANAGAENLGGKSFMAGDGGDGGISTVQDGTIPGGGGGAIENTGTSGAGARGEVRVYEW